ncbi:SDR family oxidoreductase [Microcella sp.]|uniref:SDR family oxidoreductase n=1 Tax=Microcella sp. TaxID=1913979 RepID=UPI00256381C1|nr:SDR family oxidoreductase [Microcella sp.]MBX9472521.1 SDR family oxidoreductase [Microcella sp.]
MRIAIAGGHGQIARLLARRLVEMGHEPVALIRKADQSADIESDGARPVVIDLEHTDDALLAEALTGCDAAVFAAGAGPGSGPARKLTLDRDGAILLADACVQAGVTRLVVISSRRADSFDPDSDDGFQIYLRAKSEADAAVRAHDALDWTIVRPGGLTDEPATGMLEIGENVEGSIPRSDVAHLVAELVTSGRGVHRQFEVVAGSTPIAELSL